MMSRRLLVRFITWLHRPQRVRILAPFRLMTSTKILVATSSGMLLYKCALSKKVTVFAREIDSDEKIIEEADRLYNTSGNVRNLYDYLKQYESSSNSNILWRLARSARDLAGSSGVSSDEKKLLTYEAFECSKRALAANEKNFAAHKWYAITLGDVGDYEGVKMKISNAYIIRDHLQHATELNPSDATTLHCLGMWCYVFADMPWWQHKIAGVIFATPPSSTFKEAANYFMDAERVDPNFYSVNLLMLGKCYMKMGDQKRAMLFLDRAATFPPLNTEDEQAKIEAANLLKRIVTK